MEGEIISDFKCDGCNKKVDISKRTLVANTPNVLILHLQRIEFNFEKMQNDKINSYFEFPQVLDLKPYSYFDVMEKEERLPKEKSDDGDGEEQDVVKGDK